MATESRDSVAWAAKSHITAERTFEYVRMCFCLKYKKRLPVAYLVSFPIASYETELHYIYFASGHNFIRGKKCISRVH